MTKEEQLLKKRFIELSKISYNRSIPVFSNFLNLNEQNILYSALPELIIKDFKLYGGYSFAERQMAAFIPDAFCYGENDIFPIKVIKITPVNSKFADKLTHRDFLGALINLGIERGKLGDIIVKENKAYVFCSDKLAAYIMEQLFKIKHTNVSLEESELKEFEYVPEFKIMKGSVASERIDSMLTVCCACSRSEAVSHIMAREVFINGRLVEANSINVKEDDRISVRGVGKFIFSKVISETKKGRIYVEIKKYI